VGAYLLLAQPGGREPAAGQGKGRTRAGAGQGRGLVGNPLALRLGKGQAGSHPGQHRGMVRAGSHRGREPQGRVGNQAAVEQVLQGRALHRHRGEGRRSGPCSAAASGAAKVQVRHGTTC
jgi:hypothetical protein